MLAGPSTTNTGEQKHRDRNREGVKGTLLAGIMRGMQYDWRSLKGIENKHVQKIKLRNVEATTVMRVKRSVQRAGKQGCACD